MESVHPPRRAAGGSSPAAPRATERSPLPPPEATSACTQRALAETRRDATHAWGGTQNRTPLFLNAKRSARGFSKTIRGKPAFAADTEPSFAPSDTVPTRLGACSVQQRFPPRVPLSGCLGQALRPTRSRWHDIACLRIGARLETRGGRQGVRRSPAWAGCVCAGVAAEQEPRGARGVGCTDASPGALHDHPHCSVCLRSSERARPCACFSKQHLSRSKSPADAS